jgi:hypothetical protein
MLLTILKLFGIELSPNREVKIDLEEMLPELSMRKTKR